MLNLPIFMVKRSRGRMLVPQMTIKSGEILFRQIDFWRAAKRVEKLTSMQNGWIGAFVNVR